MQATPATAGAVVLGRKRPAKAFELVCMTLLFAFPTSGAVRHLSLAR